MCREEHASLHPEIELGAQLVASLSAQKCEATKKSGGRETVDRPRHFKVLHIHGVHNPKNSTNNRMVHLLDVWSQIKKRQPELEHCAHAVQNAPRAPSYSLLVFAA
jgi:hypothetical protein